MSLLKGIVELGARGRVCEEEHHQREAQDDPGDEDSGKGYLCRLSVMFLRTG